MVEINRDKVYRLLSEMLSAIEENPDMVETELRNTYITELIYALGWPENNVETEKGLKLATTNHRVDYNLSYKGKSKVAMEIKRPKEPLSKEAESQLGDYLFKLKSDIGIAFNGVSLTVMNTNGRPLAHWKFEPDKGIPKNVNSLIDILERYLAYNYVIKGNFGKDKEGNKESKEDFSKDEDKNKQNDSSGLIESNLENLGTADNLKKEDTRAKNKNNIFIVIAFLVIIFLAILAVFNNQNSINNIQGTGAISIIQSSTLTTIPIIQSSTPTELLVYANVTNQSAYTNSKVKYTIKAIDSLGNSAANGTIVNVNYYGYNNDEGHLSAMSCLIENGECNITYYTPKTPANITFEATSEWASNIFNLTVISRLRKTAIVSFGSGGFCITPLDLPYIYKQAYLEKGENVTWYLNQYLPESSVFVLYGNATFHNFTIAVQKATQNYTNFVNMCSNGINSSNMKYCNSYSFYPYLALQNYIENLNPISIYIPVPLNYSYVGNLNFITPYSGNYYFVIFPLKEQYEDALPLQLNKNLFGVDICYTNSYVYNTTTISS